jgi:aldose 1-epimerase
MFRAFAFTTILCCGLATTAVAGGTLTVEPFGKTADGVAVDQFVLQGQNGSIAKIITRGATLRSFMMKDNTGKMDDVLLGFDTVAGYESDDNQYFGCTVGRVCNRIGKASFDLDGQTYKLFANDGENTLHGGNGRSFDKVVWKGAAFSVEDGVGVEFTYFSADGEEGFPGNLHATVRYVLTDDGSLAISYKATCDLMTPVNLTNHAYFNLSGAGAETILDHVLMIDADSYTPTDDKLIPTGEILTVEGTPLDFRKPTVIGKRIDSLTETAAIGYDHNLVLTSKPGSVRRVAALRHPTNGRLVSILTDQPGLQFYSGNFLKGQIGKDGKKYAYRSGLCLEAQHYPDSVHHENFPSIWLNSGETYRQTTVYKFETE